jgi:type IV pilus assembly protein PilE
MSQRKLNTKSASKGFTLIELVVAIAIVGILTAIAIPNYTQSVLKSRRKAAAACVVEQATFMERFYTTNLTYAGAVLPLGGCRTDLNGFYNLAFNGVPTATTYGILATAVGGQTADADCLNMGINQTGQKTISGSGTVQQCWNR